VNDVDREGTEMTDTQQETRPARVLVVDDEPSLLRALEALLRKKGHEVTALESPIAATQKLAQEDFDVALLDVKMPQLSGLELLNAVKLRRPEVEVIMMTASPPWRRRSRR
jgi:two-component system response regulator HydG